MDDAEDFSVRGSYTTFSFCGKVFVMSGSGSVFVREVIRSFRKLPTYVQISNMDSPFIVIHQKCVVSPMVIEDCDLG